MNEHNVTCLHPPEVIRSSAAASVGLLDYTATSTFPLEHIGPLLTEAY